MCLILYLKCVSPNDKTISSLTEEETILLCFFDENGQIKLPWGGTLHYFVKYRLGEEGSIR
jgi:hypothetical protein